MRMEKVVTTLTDKLKSDAAGCAGRDECTVCVTGEYCLFGPADRCHEVAELLAALIAEHEAAMESARSLWKGASDTHAKAHEAHRNAVADTERIIREREAG